MPPPLSPIFEKKSHKDATRPQRQDPRHVVSLSAILASSDTIEAADEVHHNHENFPDDHRVKMRYCQQLRYTFFRT